MTNVEEIKKGDRVRATHTNGDTAEFTATLVARGYVESATNCFYGDEWTFERIAPPLPTGEFAVVGSRDNAYGEHYILRGGVWMSDGGRAKTAREVQAEITDNGFEVIFPGIEGAGA